MKIKWTKANSKLAKNPLKTVGFGLQAGKTCPKAGSCAKFCYAKQGAYTFKGVREARAHNKECADDIQFTTQAMNDLEKMRSVECVRIHDSGDFYNQRYLDKWITIAFSSPEKVFYAYTKSLHLNFDQVPENMKIIQSMGGKMDKQMDKTKQHAVVFKDHQTRIDAGYVDGTETDEEAYSGTIKIGLVYHGTKNITKEMELS